MSSRHFYTENGLKKIGEIVKKTRGTRSYRDVEEEVNVSYGTIRRVEIGDARLPDPTTMARLAKFAGYTLEEFQAIAMEQENQIYSYQTHEIEDLMAFVRKLPVEEAIKLSKMILDHIADKWHESTTKPG